MGNFIATKSLNKTYNLLVAFLYKTLLDSNIGESDKTHIGKVLHKLVLQKHLSESELMKEFLPTLVPFLGKFEQYKEKLQSTIEQIEKPDFNVEDILTAFLTQFTGLIESLVNEPTSSYTSSTSGYTPGWAVSKQQNTSLTTNSDTIPLKEEPRNRFVPA